MINCKIKDKITDKIFVELKSLNLLKTSEL